LSGRDYITTEEHKGTYHLSGAKEERLQTPTTRNEYLKTIAQTQNWGGGVVWHWRTRRRGFEEDAGRGEALRKVYFPLRCAFVVSKKGEPRRKNKKTNEEGS